MTIITILVVLFAIYVAVTTVMCERRGFNWPWCLVCRVTALFKTKGAKR